MARSHIAETEGDHTHITDASNPVRRPRARAESRRPLQVGSQWVDEPSVDLRNLLVRRQLAGLKNQIEALFEPRFYVSPSPDL
jgi:hypothetical protein